EDAEVVTNHHPAERRSRGMPPLRVREHAGRAERAERDGGEVGAALARRGGVEQQEEDRAADERDFGKEDGPVLRGHQGFATRAITSATDGPMRSRNGCGQTP